MNETDRRLSSQSPVRSNGWRQSPQFSSRVVAASPSNLDLWLNELLNGGIAHSEKHK